MSGRRSLLLALACTACMPTRSFRHPDERVTLDTAYTIGRGQVRIDAGVNAAGTDNFAANLKLAYGFGRFAQVETNLAHAALGVPNARLKYNFLNLRRLALSGELGLLYTSPSMLWALPAETRDELGDIDIFSVPIELRGTVPVFDWLDLSLGVGYTAMFAWGTVEDPVTVYEGAFGPRSFYLEPALTFYLGGHVALLAGARLPPYTAIAGELVVTETVAPGIQGGLRTVDWAPVRFEQVVSVHAGVELRFGWRTHLQLFVSHNAISRYLGVPVMPGVNLYWRLP